MTPTQQTTFAVLICAILTILLISAIQSNQTHEEMVLQYEENVGMADQLRDDNPPWNNEP